MRPCRPPLRLQRLGTEEHFGGGIRPEEWNLRTFGRRRLIRRSCDTAGLSVQLERHLKSWCPRVRVRVSASSRNALLRPWSELLDPPPASPCPSGRLRRRRTSARVRCGHRHGTRQRRRAAASPRMQERRRTYRAPVSSGRHLVGRRWARLSRNRRPLACQAMRRSTGSLSTTFKRPNPRTPASRRRPGKLRHR